MKRQTVHQLILDSIGSSEVVKIASKVFDITEARKVSEGLAKVASFDINPDTYHALCGMMKIASEVIGSAVANAEETKGHVAQLEKVAEIRTMVDEMVDAGFIDEFNAQEKIAELSGKNSDEIAIVKEAMKLQSASPGNIFSEETEKTAELADGKKAGMFDNVLE